MNRLLPLVLLCAIAGCRPSPSTAPPAPAPNITEKAIPVDATALYETYHSNLAKAETTYTGKLVAVSGLPARVEKDSAGRYFLSGPANRLVKTGLEDLPKVAGLEELGQLKEQAAANAKYVPGVIFYIRASDLKQFADLDQTKPIAVTGRCAGSKKDDGAEPGFVVTVEDCLLAGAPK
jgi:hypothetical protein